MSKEKQKQILLAVLAVVFVGVVVNQFVLYGDDRPAAPAGKSEIRNPKSETNPKSEIGEGYRPLPLEALGKRRRVREQPERNVFVYYVPPPPPPDPPPSPPPLTIRFVNPPLVYAGTEAFTLQVTGLDLPEDAQIFINRRPMPTTYVSESELSTEVGGHLISTSGQLSVEVKNTTGELYSTSLSIRVEKPPQPTYKYVGRIDKLVYLQKGKDDRIEAHLGETVEDRWRVADVTDENVVLEDIAKALGIQHTITIEDRATLSRGSRFTRGQRVQRPRSSRPSSRRSRSRDQQQNQSGQEEQP